ncbi:uncharacterized protein F54H12.2-like [Acanthaster planci]|uniref:Uncharacterized protein F54H12.2-like n=1 Tax=Acanthaster planci TaxID=133434 RepID=A0A8B7Y624_ACAPL|nr:uncharacterized protein F54H12.2-like [Acanthaster planci]
MIGKEALKTGVGIVADTLDGQNVKTAAKKRTSILKGQWVQYNPLTNIVDSDYLDLAHTLINVKVKVVNINGADLGEGVPVAPVNLLLHSLFSEVDVTLNDKLVSSSSNAYPYRALLETLLTYGPPAKASQLTAALFYKDTAGKMDSGDPTAEEKFNKGLKRRYKLSEESRIIDMLGPIHGDIFFQDRFLLNGVNLKLKFHRSKNSFCLMAALPDTHYKVKIMEASLNLRKVVVSPTLALAHAKTLQSATAKYPLRRVEVKTFSIPLGNQSFSRENLFLGQIPRRVVIGMVDNAAFNGDYHKNPYNFKHYGLNYLGLYVDNEQTPWRPLQPKFSGKDEAYMMSYQTLYSGINTLFGDKGNQINREDYESEYSLFAFDLSPDLSSGSHFNLVKRNNMRLELKFAEALTTTVNVVVYSEFESILEVDESRNILIDYAN